MKQQNDRPMQQQYETNIFFWWGQKHLRYISGLYDKHFNKDCSGDKAEVVYI